MSVARPQVGEDLWSDRTFVHLHLHTEYSLLDGGNRIDRLVRRVKDLGMPAVAITDHGNLFGAVAFYLACQEAGVRPILGVEAYVTPPGRHRSDRTYSGGGEGGYHLVLLCENNTGWQNLLDLCSEAYLTGFYYRPRLDRELLAHHAQGLIAIAGHLGTEIGDHLLAFERTREPRHWEAAVESAAWHARTFRGSDAGPGFYIELQHHVPEQNAINPHLIRLARELRLPLVCDNDAHFLTREDHDAHDTLVCISTGKGKRDGNRLRYSEELYVKSPDEMRALFEPYGDAGREALENTVRIARRCQVDLPLGHNHAPLVRVALPPGDDLPRHDEARFGGDLEAWYRQYCARFEVSPLRLEGGLSPAEQAALTVRARQECNQALRLLARAGAVWRYGPDVFAEPGTDRARAIRARLDRELHVICDKGISAYFLIVWDFVNWARMQGIPGLARGSGVGTMVGYVLGLSNACPIRYGLLFERFTDPDRSEYPDIDIDLCQDGRPRVIEYVRRKYGQVAQIITFGTLKARAAVRDVARVLQMPLAEADRLARLIPEQPGMTLDEALTVEPDLRRVYESDPRAREVIEQARRLEGQARHASVHAAGVIVATRPLREVVPLYRQNDAAEDEIVTQWDGPTCERMGLLKMDFLGLRTLSIIERCKALIRATLPERAIWQAVGRGDDYDRASPPDGQSPAAGRPTPHPLDLDRLSFDDQRVFELFRRGETTGVFQFESPGMKRLLMEMKPDRLEDLIAANALFRPGPMDLMTSYVRRKHGLEPVPRVHPVVDEFTAETYGVMVYQEQVMQVVHGLGGISLREAYTLIKNISRKREDKVSRERPRFLEGAMQRGLTRQRAEELFDMILKFAGYGFNKSHSTAYAIVAYQTAYLKTYFPTHYMAAFLTYESAAQRVSDWTPYLEECRSVRVIEPRPGGRWHEVRVGVEVCPPDVNLSDADFTVAYRDDEPRDAWHGHVRFGLRAIRGAGDKAIEAIIRCRDGAKPPLRSEAVAAGSAGGTRRPYRDLLDFCERVAGAGNGTVNRATIEALIKAGAFDSLHGRQARAALCASLEQALQAGQRTARDRAVGQGALFGMPSQTPRDLCRAAPVAPWSESETLTHEKEALGFYISSHPLAPWEAWARALEATPVAELNAAADRQRVLLAVVVQSVRTDVHRTGPSAGQKWARALVEDRTGAVEAILFADAYAAYGHLLHPDALLFVIGDVDRARGTTQVRVLRALPVDGCPRVPTRSLDVLLDATRLGDQACETTRRAAATLRAATGTRTSAADGSPLPRAPVRVFVRLAANETAMAVPVGRGWIVRPTPELVRTLESLLGEGCVRINGPLLTVERSVPMQKPNGSLAHYPRR